MSNKKYVNQHTMDELRMKQALPLGVKVRMTQERIRQWVQRWGEDSVYVSFSGGKDSTVLLHLVRDIYPDIPAVFVNTSNEFPGIKEFAKSFDNVEVLTPEKGFARCLKEYGYPIIGKEVSEAVEAARKWLNSRIDGIGGGQRYKYKFEQITGTGTYSKLSTRNTRQISDILPAQTSWSGAEGYTGFNRENSNSIAGQGGGCSQV